MCRLLNLCSFRFISAIHSLSFIYMPRQAIMQLSSYSSRNNIKPCSINILRLRTSISLRL